MYIIFEGLIGNQLDNQSKFFHIVSLLQEFLIILIIWFFSQICNNLSKFQNNIRM